MVSLLFVNAATSGNESSQLSVWEQDYKVTYVGRSRWVSARTCTYTWWLTADGTLAH